MKIIENKLISGVFEIHLCPRRDDRGFFMRIYDEEIFKKYGLNRHWVQENHSFSIKKGVIRGLHFQLPPFSETKLIRCIRGSIFDVFVDLRKGSSSFGKWGSIELSAEKYIMIYIPSGFAHGFCSLTKESEVVYKVDSLYSPEYECGLLWNDQDLSIPWPIEKPNVSCKDTQNLTLKEFIKKYNYINLREQS